MVLPALRSVMDSPSRLTIGGSSDTKKTAMVGAVFVPVVIEFARELDKHDFMTQRCVLDILLATFFKHDVRSVELAALSAMQNLADFAGKDGSAENRLLAVRVLQTALVRIGPEILTRAVP